MKLSIKKGTTSKRIGFFALDSSKTDGSGLAGLLYNTASLTWYYWRENEGNADATSVTLADATRGTFTSGGFIAKDATNLPGAYEISPPDAALADGASWVIMMLKGAANMAPVLIEIQLTDNTTKDVYDRIGAAGAGLTDLGGMSTGMKGEVNAEADSAFATWAPPTKAEMDTAHALLATAAALVTTDAVADAIKAVTDNLPDSGALSDLATILTDTGTTLPATLATIAAYIDTEVATLITNLATVDTVVDAIKAVTDAFPDGGALTAIAANAARLTAARAQVLTDWIDGGRLDLLLDSISSSAIANAVWDELQTEHVIAGSFGKFLDAAISGVGGAVGSGSSSWTLTIKDGSNNAIQDCEVWVSNDLAGSNVVAGTVETNAQGEVTFLLDPGTYYRWAQKAGQNFTNPQSFVVT